MSQPDAPAVVFDWPKRKKLDERTRMRVYARHSGTCALCLKSSLRLFKRDRYDAGADLAEIDHILAVRDGGTNLDENLRLLCLSCNRKKAGEAARLRRTVCA